MVKWGPGNAIVSGIQDCICIPTIDGRKFLAVITESNGAELGRHLRPGDAVVSRTSTAPIEVGKQVLTVATHSNIRRHLGVRAGVGGCEPSGSEIVRMYNKPEVVRGTNGSEVLARKVRSHIEPVIAGCTGDVREGPRDATVGGQVNTLVVHRHGESVARGIRSDGGVSSGCASARPGDTIVIRHVHRAIFRSSGRELSRTIGGSPIVQKGLGAK